MHSRRPSGSSVRRTGEFLQRLQGSTLLSPLFLVAALFLFLTANGQVHEALIFIVEPGNANCATHLVGGFVGAVALVVGLFYGYLSACVTLRKSGIGYGQSLFYTTDDEHRSDRLIIRIRDAFAVVCASIPLVTITTVFWLAAGVVADRKEHAAFSTAWFPSQFCAPSSASLDAHLNQVGNVWLLLSIMTVVTLCFASRVRLAGIPTINNWPLRWRMAKTQLPWWLFPLPIAVLLVPLPLLMWMPDTHALVYEQLGPLATLLLVVMALSWLLFFVAERSKLSGIPIVALLAIVVFGGGLALWIERSLHFRKLEQQVLSPGHGGQRPLLELDFRRWLNARVQANPKRDPKPYPVLVIAAPGGGIYAASFFTSVMSRLEAECPGISQHVFAISGVSGGALGASIYNAVSRQVVRSDDSNCSGSAELARSKQHLLRQALTTDHLSPTIGTTVPDVVSTLAQILSYEAQRLTGSSPKPPDLIGGRAVALELSFSRALRRTSTAVPGPSPICGGCAGLEEPFYHHWAPKKLAAPALVLNTTWAETGERIAYAPFALKGVGDQTLRAMSELIAVKDESLIEAAVASARFPAVLPAKVYGPGGKFWWNFVDGGYADASGTTTALDIYKALEEIREKDATVGTRTLPAIDIKLLVLTEDVPSAHVSDGGDATSGPGLVHAISPITTMLTIREQISRRAVERAVSELKEWDGKTNDSSPCWQVVRVKLDSKELRLPLGWLLSRNAVDAIDAWVAEKNADVFAAIKRSVAEPAGPEECAKN